MNSISIVGGLLAALIFPASMPSAEVSDAIGVPGATLVATVHAQGAQVYECKADNAGKLAWQFREPIATLLMDGKTIGRHYAGPNWEMTDGSAIVGKVAAKSAGATPTDIPLLKLDVTAHRGDGLLTGVSTVQRLNTTGGVAQGPCQTAGAFLSVAYTADYVFYRRTRASQLPQELAVESWRTEEVN